MGVVTTYTFDSSTETVTNTKLNNLVADLLTEFNGNIENSNIKAGAAIANSKLNLSNIAQTIQFDGSTTFAANVTFASQTIADLGTVTTADINGGTIDGVTIGGAAAGAGTFTTLTATGNVALGDGADTLTINCSSGITFTPAATWTFTGNQTVSGTWADLGTVTTVDIDGGTLDGVQIGGTTATGELIVNDASDAADGLGSQGTSGQYLRSAGAGANPTWGSVMGEWISKTSMAAATNSGDISITDGQIYKVIIEATNTTASTATVSFRFNSDSGNHYANSPSAPGTDTEIDIGTIGNSTGDGALVEFIIGRFSATTDRYFVLGEVITGGAANTAINNIGGMWDNSAAVTDFEIISDQALNAGINVYRLNQA